MDIGTSIIIGSVISLFGFVIMLQLNTHNWFKKENFKMQKTNIMNENKIKFRKLEKEMGLTPSKLKGGESGLNSVIGEVISNYISGQQESGGGGIGDVIGNFLEENPEVVNSFIKGFTNRDGGQNPKNSQLFET